MLRNYVRFGSAICRHRNKITSRQCSNRSGNEGGSDRDLASLITQWSRRFEDDGVPEPVASIEHILAHVVGTTKVRYYLMTLPISGATR